MSDSIFLFSVQNSRDFNCKKFNQNLLISKVSDDMMSSYLGDHLEEVEEEVYNATRQCQFDFNAVSILMKAWCNATNRSRIEHEMTPATCRKIYADYFAKIENAKSKSILTDDIPLENVTKPKIKFDVSKYDNLSFDDMMEMIKQQELENMRLKENIFDRVLLSLKEGISESNIHENNKLVEPDVSLMQALVNEQKREKELLNEKAHKIAVEKKEREDMEIQRELLRNRHMEDNSNELEVICNYTSPEEVEGMKLVQNSYQ